MKKTLQVLLIALLSLTFLFSFTPSLSYAKTDVNLVTGNMETVNEVNMGQAEEIGGKIVNALWIVSIVVAVVVLTIIGLKFIVGSASEKAEYKKSFIPLIVGILVIVFATTIVKVVFSLA